MTKEQEAIRDQWLEDNAQTIKDKVPYGDTYVEMDCGYSDEDWQRAEEYAKEKLNINE